MWIKSGLFSLIFNFFLHVECKTLDILTMAKPKHGVISGVLSPASLSFNGKEIYQSSDSFEALLLNDQLVPTTDSAGFKTIYLEIEDTSIDLKWKKHNGEIVPLLKIEYPSVTQMNFVNNKIIFKFNTITSEARLDSENLKLSGKTAQFTAEHISNWFSETHTLELFSEKKTSQIYNLNFNAYKNELLTIKSWSFYRGDAPFFSNENSDAYGFGFRTQYESRRSLEYIFSFSQSTYSNLNFFPGSMNNITQNALLSQIKYGMNPFDTNLGDINYKRVTLGLQAEVIRYSRHATFATNIDGVNSDKAEIWYAQGGGFFRWEPMQYENYGLALGLEFRILRTQADVSRDGDRKFLGLTYNY